MWNGAAPTLKSSTPKMNSKPKNRKSLLFSTAKEKSASNEELPKNK